MENREDLKKCLTICILVSVLFIGLSIVILNFEYRKLTINYNNKINNIVYIIKKKYPNIKTEDIIKVINNNSSSKDVLKEYGIDLNKDSVIIENDKVKNKYLTIEIIIIVCNIAVIVSIFLIYNHKKEKEIKNITKYIEEINKRNYDLQIDTSSEDELSILKSEIYKTTLMLKEEALNSKKDKKDLKMSLEDISHQLKTPLTSIILMLDNLTDNPDMDKKTRDEFIRDIRKNILNINFFVQNILKLSSFDVNAIKLVKVDTKISNIVNTSLKNVLLFIDLKNITIKKGGIDSDIKIDFKWEVEALTNIIKNAIEYSKNDSEVKIEYGYNNVYSYIKVTNYGKKIDDKDLPHIFERFYKVNNSSNSFGIGLALSKAIVQKEGGTISVNSNDKKTTFIIKYFKI